MWLGNYSITDLFGLLIQTVFIQNILLSYFLGMCSYLACSNRMSTAHGLGAAVTAVTTLSGSVNWWIHHSITAPHALAWIGLEMVDLHFLELIIFIAVVAALVQILEITLERFSPSLYSRLGIFLPLITVNCAILGALLLGVAREYPFIPMVIFTFGAGLGWWVAIALIAAIREKLQYSDIPKGLQGVGITCIMTGLIALSFMGLLGMNLGTPHERAAPFEER